MSRGGCSLVSKLPIPHFAMMTHSLVPPDQARFPPPEPLTPLVTPPGDRQVHTPSSLSRITWILR
eukprot:gene23628-biopygen8747